MPAHTAAQPAAEALDLRPRRAPRLLGLARAELTLLLRNRMQMVMAVIMPLLIPLLLLPIKDAGAAPEALAASVGSMYIMALLFVVYYTLLSTCVARRQAHVLKRLRTGEARDLEILAAAAVPALTIAAVMITLMTVISVPLLNLPTPANPLPLFVGVLLGALVMVPFALLTANISRTVESVQVTCLPFMALALIGAGAALPVELLPEFAQRLIMLVPTAPMVDLIRIGWLGMDGELWRSLAILAGWIVLGTWQVQRSFRWEPRS